MCTLKCRILAIMMHDTTSVIGRVDMLVASTSMDIDAFVDDARGTITSVFVDDA